MDNLKSLEDELGIAFSDITLLRQALVHRSYLNENPSFHLNHNERLEFLGDAVLELSVTDHLYHNYNLPEGELTNLRSAIVRGEMLAKVAQELKLDEYILLSRGEQKDTGKARDFILANAVEAVLGAIYLDQGYEATKKVIDRYITSKLTEVVALGLYVDNKSKFQELAQDKFRITPTYAVLDESGLDHAKKFLIGAYIGNKKFGEGTGTSKQEAQQDAARHALENLENSLRPSHH